MRVVKLGLLYIYIDVGCQSWIASCFSYFLTGTYFNCIMFMVASSVVSTILILNYHHRNADTHEMSTWVSQISQINSLLFEFF
jgi:CHASE2 domain-containing sensor protein